ncbi:hypothetical protein PR048_016304, partial [Dryococelus australis]
MVDTPWNSTYLMLEHLYEQKEAVSADSPNCGMELAGYVTILQPLSLAIEEQCRENVPTFLMARPILYSVGGFVKNYVSSKNGEKGSGIKLVPVLLKSLTARFHYIMDSRTHVIATALDPRFMCVVMENHEQLLAK